MKLLHRRLLPGALLLLAQHPLTAQVPPPMTCAASAGVAPTVREEGRSELIGDIVLVCHGGNPAAPVVVNLSIFLNTNITSNLTGPGPDETEALVLIDDPKPSPTLNISNGMPFVGQVKGTPAVIPSGNVFTGLRTGSMNQIVFLGLPMVPPGAGTRVLRVTNVRALPPPTGLAAASPIMAFVSISGPVATPIPRPL